MDEKMGGAPKLFSPVPSAFAQQVGGQGLSGWIFFCRRDEER